MGKSVFRLLSFLFVACGSLKMVWLMLRLVCGWGETGHARFDAA